MWQAGCDPVDDMGWVQIDLPFGPDAEHGPDS